jgi:hypothetical protein
VALRAGLEGQAAAAAVSVQALVGPQQAAKEMLAELVRATVVRAAVVPGRLALMVQVLRAAQVLRQVLPDHLLLMQEVGVVPPLLQGLAVRVAGVLALQKHLLLVTEQQILEAVVEGVHLHQLHYTMVVLAALALSFCLCQPPITLALPLDHPPSLQAVPTPSSSSLLMGAIRHEPLRKSLRR